jgi:hypothetical protein
MPEILADSPAPACFSLHRASGIEENQSPGPDRFRFSARDSAGSAPDRAGSARDWAGRFAGGHSGNPKGRPRGIPNPQRRSVTLQAWRANPEACKALFRRQPKLLRRLLRQILPPASARDPAERLGIDLSAIRTPPQAQRAIKRVWSALARGEIGTAEAARLARRIGARLRAAQRRKAAAPASRRQAGSTGRIYEPGARTPPSITIRRGGSDPSGGPRSRARRSIARSDSRAPRRRRALPGASAARRS